LVHIHKIDGSAASAFGAAFKNDFKFFRDKMLFNLGSRRLVDVRMSEVRGRMLLITDGGLGPDPTLPISTWNSIWG